MHRAERVSKLVKNKPDAHATCVHRVNAYDGACVQLALGTPTSKDMPGLAIPLIGTLDTPRVNEMDWPP